MEPLSKDFPSGSPAPFRHASANPRLTGMPLPDLQFPLEFSMRPARTFGRVHPPLETQAGLHQRGRGKCTRVGWWRRRESNPRPEEISDDRVTLRLSRLFSGREVIGTNGQGCHRGEGSAEVSGQIMDTQMDTVLIRDLSSPSFRPLANR